MGRVKVQLRMPPRSAFDKFERETRARLEAAALNATHVAASQAKSLIRREMAAAALGRLGNAVDGGSDLEKHRAPRRSAAGFAASGWVHIRSQSDRTRGAIEAYTAGADIAPRRGRYLWIPGVDIPARAGRARMTPEAYYRAGLDKKIGPLIPIVSDGRPLLIVEGASVSASGKARSAKGLTKRGKLRKGQIAKPVIVAFIGIRRTSREARVDVPAIMREMQAKVPGLVAEQLNRR
ncbi:hypothetical protein SAMN06295937_102334 [Sphingopyxis flava]|uniref:Uncharacterized protein n=2 Tax=Sphingopyxis flava TaxID=1507287 RepID=A0A1T5EMK1_9SPHN|nr:hypothetical protein SAMN06295937_102334 [Sphingopyxis flava]